MEESSTVKGIDSAGCSGRCERKAVLNRLKRIVFPQCENNRWEQSFSFQVAGACARAEAKLKKPSCADSKSDEIPGSGLAPGASSAAAATTTFRSSIFSSGRV